MKLYLYPGACSLADHIALHEAGLTFEHVTVDLRAHRTASGEDYYAINPKGYVPALTLDSGETLTENIAILDWIAHQRPELKPEGALGHTRLLETLAFISTELHKSFGPMFGGGSDDEKAKAKAKVAKRLGEIDAMRAGDYLFGDAPSTADAYLFVMLLWSRRNGIDLPGGLAGFFDRMMARDATQAAMRHEGLI